MLRNGPLALQCNRYVANKSSLRFSISIAFSAQRKKVSIDSLNLVVALVFLHVFLTFGHLNLNLN